MTKGEMIEKMAKASGMSKAAATKALNAFVDGVSGCLKKGGTFTMPGFGSWRIAARKARTGVNPRTGAKIKIAARKVVRWRTGKGLADMVR